MLKDKNHLTFFDECWWGWRSEDSPIFLKLIMYCYMLPSHAIGNVLNLISEEKIMTVMLMYFVTWKKLIAGRQVISYLFKILIDWYFLFEDMYWI